MRRYFTLALLAALLAGCGPSFRAATPPGFVTLDEEDTNYDYRATTADGLVLAVREIEHDPKGDMAFWLKAIENEVRRRGGYAHLETKDVQTRQGLKGKQMRFGHDESNHPHLYVITLFVTDAHIYLLEAGGTKELMTEHADQVSWVVENFRVGG